MAKKKEEVKTEAVVEEVKAEVETKEEVESTETMNEAESAVEEENYTADEEGALDEEEEAQFEAEVNKVLQRIFEKRRVHGTGKNLKDDRKIVVPVGQDFETENEKLKKEYEMLMMSARSFPEKKILEGKLVGAKEEPNLHCLVGVVKMNGKDYGRFDILIPISRLFPYDEEEFKGVEGNETLRKHLNARLGMPVRFVVYDIDVKERIAIASRLDAMEIDIRRNYLAKNRAGNTIIQEGMLVYANIVETKMDYIMVEVGGAECKIKGKDYAHYRTKGLNEIHNVGEKIIVKVNKIEPKDIRFPLPNGKAKVYKMVEIEASRRDASTNPMDLYFDKIQVGDTYRGEVTGMDEKGVFVLLENNVEVLCFVPRHGTETLHKGQGCTINIIGKDENKMQISGNIARLDN